MNLIKYLCYLTNKVWKTLKVTHEGINQVTETKIIMLVYNYELFKMEVNEFVTYVH